MQELHWTKWVFARRSWQIELDGESYGRFSIHYHLHVK
jgi:hypothetical protein